MEQNFPKVFPLNGSDYFQVFLDDHNRKYGELGNVSRLAIYLDNQPDVNALESKLRSNPYVSWMHSLRLKTSNFFRLPCWKVVIDEIHITKHDQVVDTIESCRTLFDRDIKTRKEPPIQFDLVLIKNQFAFVLSWNHILMDARGAEILLSQIEQGSGISFFAKDNFPELPWKERIKQINIVKNFLVPHVKDGIQLMHLKKRRLKSAYRIISFSKDETGQLDARANEFKVGVAKSAFYLSAIQQAFHKIAENRNVPSWVPVPQDQRRKGQLGPVMANQVSFLFYSLDDTASDMTLSVPALRNQMMDQMRTRMPKSYQIMMDSMRRFPRWLYQHMVASPTKGALASYLFSDTGDSLSSLNTFAGANVTAAMHYPPSSAYPGLTIVFMRFRGRQQIIIGFPQDLDLLHKMDTFDQALKNNLLGLDKR